MSRDAIIIIVRGLEGRGAGAGPCDTQTDDAPVLLQKSFLQPADEPAVWDLRQAHRPYLVVSCACPIVGCMYAMASLGYAGDQLSMVARGAERAIACAQRVSLMYDVLVRETSQCVRSTELCVVIDRSID